jgi:hypothetical protein
MKCSKDSLNPVKIVDETILCPVPLEIFILSGHFSLHKRYAARVPDCLRYTSGWSIERRDCDIGRAVETPEWAKMRRLKQNNG